MTPCQATEVTQTQPREAVTAIVASVAPLRNFGIAAIVIAALALIAAFIPLLSIPAGLLGLISMAIGILCLVRDPGFNTPALIGTVLSSVAVSASVIMSIVRAA
jgi:hypothetical protein